MSIEDPFNLPDQNPINPEEEAPLHVPEEFHASEPDREGIRNKLRELGIPIKEEENE